MGYYYSFPYEFSDHGIIRCRERLKLGSVDDFVVRKKVIELIKQSTHQFETNNHQYVQAGTRSNLFFVIEKNDKVIITCRPVSIEKQLSLIWSDND